jgi:hypothetical protein
LDKNDYYISAKDNEYFHVLALITNLLEKAKIEGNYATWGEILEKLKSELEENEGLSVTPWQYNMVISILLDYVPEELKNISVLK